MKNSLAHAGTVIAFLGKDKIPGGLADKKKIKDFDPKSLEEGTKVELEHTDNEDIAKEIASDHITEDINYYPKLKKMEKEAKRYIFLRKLK